MKTLDDYIAEIESKECCVSRCKHVSSEEYRQTLRKAITDAVIGELEGLEVKDKICKEMRTEVARGVHCPIFCENEQNKFWREARDSRISALRKINE